jgi:hypothetical protein
MTTNGEKIVNDNDGERKAQNGNGREYQGCLSFYHPNAGGNGAAVQFELKAAHGRREGCIFMVFGRQKTLAVRNGDGTRQMPTFDWANRITVKLGFADLCNLLLVLNGKHEQAGGGRGLFHDTAEANTVIGLRRNAEPPGYLLDVSRKAKQQGAEAQRMRVLLTEAEALGLRSIFEHSLPLLIFAPGA